MIRKILSLLLSVLLGFSVAWFLRPQRQADSHATWTLAEAVPRWQWQDCVVPTRHEGDLLEIAVSTLELTGNDGISSLNIGAQKFLAEGIWRREGFDTRPVCPPDGIYGRASKAITDHQSLSQGRITEYGLELAAKLPQPNPY